MCRSTDSPPTPESKTPIALASCTGATLAGGLGAGNFSASFKSLLKARRKKRRIDRRLDHCCASASIATLPASVCGACSRCDPSENINNEKKSKETSAIHSKFWNAMRSLRRKCVELLRPLERKVYLERASSSQRL